MGATSALAAPPFLGAYEGTLPCSTAPQLFHAPEEGRGDRGEQARRRIRQAVALCRSCPVLLACRQWAREQGESGVWGAETDEERGNAGHLPVTAATEVRPPCGTEAGAAWERRHGGGFPCADCAAAEEDARRRRRMSASDAVWPPRLSARERDVLMALAAGLERDAICARLGRTQQSVAITMGGLRKKLRTEDPGIVAAARAAGLLRGRLASAA